jgi:hypothetical protein
MTHTPVRAVRDAIDTALKLESLPATANKVRSGELSGHQAQMIARAAAANPAAERALLEKALEGLRHLRAACNQAIADVEDADERAARQKSLVKLNTWTDPDGLGAGQFHFLPQDFAAFNAILEAETDRLFREHATAHEHLAREQYAAQALLNLVLGQSEPVQRVVKYHVHVLIDHGLLTGRYTHGDAGCEIPGVGPVDPAWVRTLLDEAVVDYLIKQGKDVTTITTPSRRPTEAMKTVLLASGMECVIDGCNITGYLELDHVHEVHDGGPTCVANLEPKCSQHHDLKTKGWILGPKHPITGKRTLRPPPAQAA